MTDILPDLENAVRNKQPVAFTALVETRGSTPQKAGATMLVFSDGSQTGTLGGGCVEAEVKRKALRLLDQGRRKILTFQLDGDYGWDDGLICGGRMSMLVDPLRPGEDGSYYAALGELSADDCGCTEAVIFDPEKAGAGAAGDRYLIDPAGEIVARRVDGNAKVPPISENSGNLVPAALFANLRNLKDRPRPYVVAGISYLPRLKRCRLVIVGGGHVGQKVAGLAAEADFDIWVVDDREQFCNADRFPVAKRLIVSDVDSALSSLEVDENTFCIIVTRGHNHDEEALYHLAEKPAAYVGMIGSRRKIKLIYEDLLREGVTREALERVHAPLGFNIGSQTVPEIAVSIVAELIACRNLGAVPAGMRGGSLVGEVCGIESAL
ncbi:MAG: XdhC family protein [Planctomycetaceae bacterium]